MAALVGEGGAYEQFYDGVGALISGSTTYEWIVDHLDVVGGGKWLYPGKPYWGPELARSTDFRWRRRRRARSRWERRGDLRRSRRLRQEPLEAVVRIEFTPRLADAFLAGHPGTRVDYAVVLRHKGF